MNVDNSKLTKFNINPNYVSLLITDTPTDISQKIVRKINKENNRENIISILTELKFINLFQNLNCSILNYEQSYRIDNGKQTPDLTIKHKDCTFIAEVYRLGKSSIDSNIQDFIRKIPEHLEEIKSNHVLEFKVNFNNIDLQNFNYKDLTISIQKWFTTKPSIGSQYNYKYQIDFKLTHNHKKNKTYSFSKPVFLTIKTEKLIQNSNFNDNEITKKIRKYESLVNVLNTPFFLFIEADFLSGFHHTDFKERFHSSQTEIIDYELYQNYWTGQKMGKTWSTLGDFYEFPFLSGLVLLCDNQYKLLLSPLKNQRLYNPTYSELVNVLKEKLTEI